jgi:hypothetical protein
MNSRARYRLLALLVLTAIGAQRLVVMHKPAEVKLYQQHIREAAAAVPTQIDGWIGRDTRLPTQALNLLTPNAYVSREYTNVETGMRANVLLVHCSDAHDMAGHFPLRCYPADGWTCSSATARDWNIGNFNMTGMEYEFYKSETVGQSKAEESIVVANCLLRPGQVLRDMDAMTATIVGAGGQSSGAGQIYVLFDASVPQAERAKAIKTLVGGYRPVIDAILAPANN